MEMTARTCQILEVLLQEETPMAVTKLAERIGISKRTTQRELSYMESSLRGSGVTFASKTGRGVWLEGTKEAKAALASQVRSGEQYDASNKLQRRKRLILEILKDKGLKKIFYYSQLFGVSETTISTDLEAVENWLMRYELKVLRKPGSGVEIVGSEENYRRAIRFFIDENLDSNFLREAYEQESSEQEQLEELKTGSIAQLLHRDVLSKVVKCIVGIEDERVLNLTESSYVGLVIHISIAINRILKQEFVEEKTDWMEEQEFDEDYELAELVAERLEDEFDIQIPEVEIAYICLHIKGAKHTGVSFQKQKTLDMEKKELQTLVNLMINAYDERIAFELKQDEEFIQGLLAHLQPTIVRLLNHMQIKNPILMEVKRDYTEIYQRCQRVAKVLEEWLHKEVPEEEIGFLTIHFGAAVVRLEGKQEKLRPVQIGIICASGIGISRLMLTKIEKNFKNQVKLSTYGKNDITPYIVGKMDFFVSSLPMELESTTVIEVNPLLSEADMESIRSQISHYARLPGKEEEQGDFQQELDQVNQVAMQIKTVIRYMKLYRVKEDITFEALLEQIALELTPYQDRQNTIKEDLMRRERMGTQIFTEFGFGLLHTRTTGVVRPSFTVWLTESGKEYVNDYMKKIHVVIVMLLPLDDNLKINSEILGYLSSTLIEEYDFLELLKMGDEDAIRQQLSVYLKRFFKQYLG